MQHYNSIIHSRGVSKVNLANFVEECFSRAKGRQVEQKLFEPSGRRRTLIFFKTQLIYALRGASFGYMYDPLEEFGEQLIYASFVLSKLPTCIITRWCMIKQTCMLKGRAVQVAFRHAEDSGRFSSKLKFYLHNSAIAPLSKSKVLGLPLASRRTETGSLSILLQQTKYFPISITAQRQGETRPEKYSIQQLRHLVYKIPQTIMIADQTSISRIAQHDIICFRFSFFYYFGIPHFLINTFGCQGIIFNMRGGLEKPLLAFTLCSPLSYVILTNYGSYYVSLRQS